MGGRRVKAGHLCVGEERVRPPDPTEHLVTDTQLVLARATEVESRVMPVLSEVKVKREVLQKPCRYTHNIFAETLTTT